MLLSVAFCPPVSWFAAAARDFTLSPDRVIPSVVRLEACEHFQKQTYRNRCRILTANGIENLQVPVVHGDNLYRTPIREVRVDYSTPWIPKMERTVASAYESSAYFFHYRDDFFSLLEKAPETLWELDLSLIRFFLSKTGLSVDLHPTGTYERLADAAPAGVAPADAVSADVAPADAVSAGMAGPVTAPTSGSVTGILPPEDLRSVIHPKRPNGILRSLALEKPYFQVFAGKYGFQPDLSVMDLLFNEGPDSILYLKKL